ncbi:DsbC family protein [Luteimonas sp. SJ-92]|uniref:Thiol:disulfide interchange protein n=1 Tax=Luteimonas salinisoli TaxID=2752307 RepID=A0A853JE74_9GAMM|nr:DsbC family protein [Luteimonas salinisoli]NZA27054.1 DsbC family protein [Luteimonas salinisoli]
MKPFLFLLLGAFSLSACAQSPAPGEGGETPGPAAPAAAAPVDPGTPEGRAVATIRKLNPRVEVDRVAEAPIEGFREVVVSGQVLYVSDDGRYLLQGSLFDVEKGRDVSQDGLAQVRRELLATVPADDRIVFAPEDPDYTVTVFTDTECGYCRKLHQEIDEYNRLGIAIEYLAFPRMGPASPDFAEMVSVWCARDRRQALTDAKDGKRVPKRDCTNPVAMHYDLGQRIGLTGTPMIVTEQGIQMPGYMPPAALREALDQIAAEG